MTKTYKHGGGRPRLYTDDVLEEAIAMRNVLHDRVFQTPWKEIKAKYGNAIQNAVEKYARGGYRT